MASCAQFLLLCTLLSGTSVIAEILVKVPPKTFNTCSLPLISNLPTDGDLQNLTFLLNERYGPPPCSCTSRGMWKRLVYLDMTNSSQQCPSNWTTINSTVRGCGRSTATPACDSAIYETNTFSYNHVCGRVLGYQRGTPDAFDITANPASQIYEPYVDGVSLTYGPTGYREHIWTFAAAAYEQDPNYNRNLTCQCTDVYSNQSLPVPLFVGNNYFCETGYEGPGFHSTCYSNDPLWDGMGCGTNSTCCQFNQPPWFCTSLPYTTSDYLEIRICNDEASSDEDVIISFAEIYIAFR